MGGEKWRGELREERGEFNGRVSRGNWEDEKTLGGEKEIEERDEG